MENKLKNIIEMLEANNDDTIRIVGFQYSILKWSTVFKGLDLMKPRSILKSLMRFFEDGHAECFSFEKKGDTIHYITSGIDEKWVFDEKTDSDDIWLRKSDSVDTYIYYVEIDTETMKKFYSAVKKLKGTEVSYAVLHPNFPYTSNRFENCVSSSHALLSEAGIGWYYKGWWMPSIDNVMQWLGTKIPILNQFNGKTWQYKKFENSNCYLG